MSADRLFLVFALPHHPGVPVYLHRLAEESNGERGTTPTLRPIFDDDIERSQVWTSSEFAVQARDHWRSKGYTVTLRDREGNGPLFENGSSLPSSTERPVQHEVRFVPLVGGGVDGLGYHIRFSPERRQWYCRAIDVPSMLAEHRDKETIWASTPQDVANKLIERWTITIAVPFADPEATARAAHERQQAAEQRNYFPGLRPGDRR
jgi:hypothetical protein